MNIPPLDGRRLVLGVCGSIAAYKAVDLASKLTQAGSQVDVILTKAAGRFVTELTFRSVTGRPVYGDMWDLADHIRHVRLAEAADLLLIAPITAHTLARLAHGLADDLLTVTALAARCPLMVAPAMDGGMFEHRAVQENLARLRQRGVTILGPEEGRMASGLVGAGRLVEPARLMAHVRLALSEGGALSGRHIVVSAGPTQEPLDPVRFLSNRSTGRQGLAIAQAALDAGADVTLVTGPIADDPPFGATVRRVQTAAEMADAVLAASATADALIMAAAVSDFRPTDVATQKIKKGPSAAEQPTIALTRNTDILEAAARQRRQAGCPRVLVGFAAETRAAEAYGQAKLARKGLDLIAVNDVSQSDAGFAVPTNRITLIDRDGNITPLPLQSKYDVAREILSRLPAWLPENSPASPADEP